MRERFCQTVALMLCLAVAPVAAPGARQSRRARRKHESGAAALEELGRPRYANLLDHFPALKDYRN